MAPVSATKERDSPCRLTNTYAPTVATILKLCNRFTPRVCRSVRHAAGDFARSSGMSVLSSRAAASTRLIAAPKPSAHSGGAKAPGLALPVAATEAVRIKRVVRLAPGPIPAARTKVRRNRLATRRVSPAMLADPAAAQRPAARTQRPAATAAAKAGTSMAAGTAAGMAAGTAASLPASTAGTRLRATRSSVPLWTTNAALLDRDIGSW